MKVLVAKFMLEANTFVPTVCELTDFDLRAGQDCIDHMQMGDVFKRNNIEVISSLYARSNASGIMSKTAFDYVEQTILNDVRRHLSEIDGIFLMLHGASEVQEIGSGDHHILWEVRKIVGPYMPIGIACDPHGNLCKKYVEAATIIRSYRESPHTDIEATVAFVCQALIDQMKHPTGIQPVYRKLPLILGGEQSVSADEPVLSFNRFMNEMEKDPKILSASWHVGYIRHDTDVAGCGVVVIPSDRKYQAYAEKKADELAKYVWDKRHEFHYTGIAVEPDEAIEKAIEYPESPVFITDSGDNVTSRARGANTGILRQFLKVRKLKKSVLIASINDANAYHTLLEHEIGETIDLKVGRNDDELSSPVELKVIVKHKGRMEGQMFAGENGDYGGCVTVNIIETKIDLIIAENNHPFDERHQTQAAGADWMNYDIIVCKLGYAFPELLRDGKLCIMSLTPGATVQDIKKIPFRRIMRPMFPIDNI